MSETEIRYSQHESTESVLISVDVLASMIGLSPRTVWRQLSAGRIPTPLRIGANVRWRRSDIVDWIASGCPANKTDRRES